MIGLTPDKLLIIAVIAALVIGPQRLPAVAAALARAIRSLRGYADGAKARAREEMGVEFDDLDWKKLDPRQYDPRRIIRDALLDAPSSDSAEPAPVVMPPLIMEPDEIQPIKAHKTERNDN